MFHCAKSIKNIMERDRFTKRIVGRNTLTRVVELA